MKEETSLLASTTHLLLYGCAVSHKAGVTDAFLTSVEQALNDHELIKIKFTAFKEEKKSLAIEIAARTHSELVWIVGHVAVLYRMQPDPARRRVLAEL